MADGRPSPAEDCPIHAVSLHGRIYHQEEDMFWRTDGSSFPVSYTVTPLLKDGVLCGMVVVFRDITDRKNKQLVEKDR
jgi:PAS domain S-box-containing protein